MRIETSRHLFIRYSPIAAAIVRARNEVELRVAYFPAHVINEHESQTKCFGVGKRVGAKFKCLTIKTTKLNEKSHAGCPSQPRSAKVYSKFCGFAKYSHTPNLLGSNDSLQC